MARRHLPEDPDNHDRWLVSYADLLTLLLALFVVLYAISSLNEQKYKLLSSALSGAFTGSHGVLPAKPAAVSAPISNVESTLGLPSRRERPNDKKLLESIKQERLRMAHLVKTLNITLAPLIRSGEVTISQQTLGVLIEINARILFEPGGARLGATSITTLQSIADVLKNDTHNITVEGHTDNVPIQNTLYPSNWELSATRAGTVVRLFNDAGIDARRLIASGRGSTIPLADNSTAAGRARNRRVSIFIATATS